MADNDVSTEHDKGAVPPDDMNATTPLGVGERINTRGEDATDKNRENRESPADGDGAGPPADEVTGINP
jgi:hypothetical protein